MSFCDLQFLELMSGLVHITVYKLYSFHMLGKSTGFENDSRGKQAAYGVTAWLFQENESLIKYMHRKHGKTNNKDTYRLVSFFFSCSSTMASCA